jgi:hypothetical protein
MTEDQFVHALLNFESREPSPRLRPDPFHLRELAEHVRAAFSAPHLDTGFADLLRRAIFDGLSRVDDLRRDDSFWAGSNQRPTIGKVKELAGLVLSCGLKEEWACWAWASTSLLWCSNDFGLPGWRGLHELGKLAAAWPVSAALHVWRSSGLDTTADLVSFLCEAKACVSARNALEAVEARGDERIAGWAREVARGCPVASDPEWLGWRRDTVAATARAIQAEQAWGQLPVLADALEDAGCDDAAVLAHLRGPGPHPGHCWVVDFLLGEA